MSKPKTIDGAVYDKQAVADLREAAIEMRDASLKAGAFDWAVSLSHIIAVLALFIEELEE